MSNESHGSKLTRFEATNHTCDGGGGSLAGALQLASILISVGVLLGFAVSYVSQWFYLILLFPLAMGLALGFVGAITIERYKIRKPAICGAAGFVAGCFCLLTMHYCDYQRLEGNLAEIPEEVREIGRNIDQLAAQGDQQPPEVRDLIAQLRQKPALLRILRIRNFWEFMNYQAEEGVTISGKHGNPMNLGYTGSFIYWGVEALLLAGMSWGFMLSAASEPFCTQCNSWKQQKPLFTSAMPPDSIANVIKAGELGELESILTSTDTSDIKFGVSTRVTVHTCEHCETAPFELKVIRVTVNGKGEESVSQLAFMTYPGEAWTPLQRLVLRMDMRDMARPASDATSDESSANDAEMADPEASV